MQAPARSMLMAALLTAFISAGIPPSEADGSASEAHPFYDDLVFFPYPDAEEFIASGLYTTPVSTVPAGQGVETTPDEGEEI